MRLYGLIALYDMHTEFYTKALAGVSDTSAQSRLDTQANHMAWLAGSMLQERFELAGLFGIASQQTHHALFQDHQGIRDGETYPPLQDFIRDWEEISPRLREVLCKLTAAQLDDEIDMEGWNMPHFDLIAFDIYREANIIGQLILWRRLLGYPALKYD